MSASLAASSRRTIGLGDIPRVLIAPRRVFARVEDVAAYGWSLLILLALVTLIGYAKVETGLIDREVDRAVNERIAAIERMQHNVVERSARAELYKQHREMGEFMKLLTRMRVIVLEPATALATALLVSAVLYGVVALSGRKPEWHTLMTVCVLAGFVDAFRLLIGLVLMLLHGSLAVDTSLSPVAGFFAVEGGPSPTALAAMSGALTGLDPFRIWYWALIIIGVWTTAQLRGWRAWLVCVLGWLIGAGVRSALAAYWMYRALGSASTA